MELYKDESIIRFYDELIENQSRKLNLSKFTHFNVYSSLLMRLTDQIVK